MNKRNTKLVEVHFKAIRQSYDDLISSFGLSSALKFAIVDIFIYINIWMHDISFSYSFPKSKSNHHMASLLLMK